MRISADTLILTILIYKVKFIEKLNLKINFSYKQKRIKLESKKFDLYIITINLL
jgi:hypothetical protein